MRVYTFSWVDVCHLWNVNCCLVTKWYWCLSGECIFMTLKWDLALCRCDAHTFKQPSYTSAYCCHGYTKREFRTNDQVCKFSIWMAVTIFCHRLEIWTDRRRPNKKKTKRNWLHCWACTMQTPTLRLWSHSICLLVVHNLCVCVFAPIGRIRKSWKLWKVVGISKKSLNRGRDICFCCGFKASQP